MLPLFGSEPVTHEVEVVAPAGMRLDRLSAIQEVLWLIN
jgi:hypothetical protein